MKIEELNLTDEQIDSLGDVLHAVTAYRQKRDATQSTYKQFTPPASPNSDRIFDLADGRRVGVVADMHCGKAVLSVTELEAASPNASEKCCGSCQAEATLRDLIDAFDQYASSKIGSDRVRAADVLNLRFELARESLAPRVDGRGTKK